MVNQKNVIIAALMITGGIIAFFLFFQSDEAKIKKTFHRLSKKVEKQEDENELLSAAAANKIKNMFGQSCRIEIPSYDVDKSLPKNEIASHVLYARARYRTMSLKFYDFQFQFPEKGSSIVDLTAVFKAVTASGDPVDEIHEFECALSKIEDEWLFTGIKGIDVLER
jgi:hypothetical protein